MAWWELAILVVLGVTGGTVLSSLSLFWVALWLRSRKSYSAFLQLSARHKLAFFRLLLRDENNQIPFYVRLIPVALAFYLSIPFDIVPDFVPVLGDLDDIAMVMLSMVLIIELTPRSVTLELLQQAQREPTPSPAGEGPSTEETTG